MKKVVLLILVLSACSPLVKPLPTATFIELPTATPTLTETLTPTNISTTAPTLEPISGGRSTFHSLEYGFSFQYPAVYDAGFNKPEIDPQAFCDFQTGEDSNGDLGVWIGVIWILVRKTDQSLEEFSNEYVKEMSLNWDISSLNQIMLGNSSAVQLEYIHKTKSRWGVKTYTIHHNNLFLLQYYEAPFSNCSPPKTGYSDYWVYEQIINTWIFDE